MILDFCLLIWIAPALLLGLLAQMMLKSTYAKANQVAARMSGFSAARQILDSAGLREVAIEQVPGHLSDHYDPRHKVLRLSSEVFHGRSMAAVGIAAHEAGHALQDAQGYLPLQIRNFAVPVASGAQIGMLLMAFGFAFPPLLLVGIVVFSGTVFFQLINLPVEFNASSRAKRQLAEMGIVSPDEMRHVRRVLTAAALTYVAGTLQAVLTLLYYIMRYTNRR